MGKAKRQRALNGVSTTVRATPGEIVEILRKGFGAATIRGSFRSVTLDHDATRNGDGANAVWTMRYHTDQGDVGIITIGPQAGDSSCAVTAQTEELFVGWKGYDRVKNRGSSAKQFGNALSNFIASKMGVTPNAGKLARYNEKILSYLAKKV